MSVKIKMILGFVIILVMVMVQSYLIVSMNDKRDEMSQQALALFQLNVVMKDRVIELKTLENDLFNIIQTKQPVLGADALNPLNAVNIAKQLTQWYDAFILSSNYQKLNDALKQKVLDMKPYLLQINDAINAIRNIPPAVVDKRMKVFETEVRTPVVAVQNLAGDFVGQNSQFFSVQNRSLLVYSEDMKRNQKITIGAALLFIIFIIFYAQYLLKPLNWLMVGVSRITEGDMTYKVQKRNNDELGRLAEQFNRMTGEIKAHRDNLEDLVRQRTQQLMEAKEALEHTNEDLTKTNNNLEEARRIMDLDMKMAVNVQLSFFLKRPPKSPEWEISFVFLPMAGVAGDMYDFYTDQQGNVTGATLMDVSGHGIASGLITMIAKSVIFRNFNKYTDQELSKVIEHINDELIGELGNVDNYLTGILLRFKGNLVEYINAGHTELLIKRGDNGLSDIVRPEDNRSFKGYFLGLEAMKMPFGQVNFTMNKGDTLLMFSDCLNESCNEAGEEFGIPRVMEKLNEAPGDSVNDIVRYITNSLHSFTGTTELNDDLTIIAVKRLV